MVPRAASLALLFAHAACAVPAELPSDDDSAAPGSDDDSAGDDDSTVVQPCGFVDFADAVVEAPGATGSGYGDPTRAVNGVRGGGELAGGQDVYSLAVAPAANSSITIRWSGREVIPGPGHDLVVFENPFRSGDSVFMEQAIVEVSRDGQNWVAFPHDYTAPDETIYSSDPGEWLGFAGVTPVLFHQEDHCVDPWDPALAGGDRFDLADLPQDGEGGVIASLGFTFLRLTTAPSRTNPDTGIPYPQAAVATGADLDGAFARALIPSP